MTETTNPSALRSQKEITDALITLMKKYPYSEITVKQIILEARLAGKTFYRNFTSKDDVLMSLIKCILLDYFSIVNNAESDVLTTIFSFAETNRELLSLLDKNDMLYLPMQYMNESIPYIGNNQNKEMNPFVKLFDGLESDYLIAMNTGAVWNVISLWIHRGMTDDTAYVRDNIRKYIRRISDM
ncbi:MAG: TetR/AcrR family transcriptional regulator [Oscillospiraceae bacterium]|nr:TetR/AcrR family transcriptional regulator [Oscillospiraceae bacterium]